MTLLDLNLLRYAHNPYVRQYERAVAWWRNALEGALAPSTTDGYLDGYHGASHPRLQGAAMTRTASIAEARNQLPALVHRAESGESITLTRRGKTVAVLLSITEFQRLQRGGVGDFWQAVEAFRAREDLDRLDLGGALSGVRDTSSGREVSW